MGEAARKQGLKPVAQREAFWDEEEHDAPAAKRSRLY